MTIWSHFIEVSKCSLEGHTFIFFLLLPFFSFFSALALFDILTDPLSPTPLLPWSDLKHTDRTSHAFKRASGHRLQSLSPLAACDRNRAGDVPVRYSERLFFLKSDYLWMSSSSRLLPGSCWPQAASFLGDSWWLYSCKRNVFLSFRAWRLMTHGDIVRG